jgi:hypothetical protein
MGWAGHVARMEEMRGAYTDFDGETWNRKMISKTYEQMGRYY